MAKEAIVEFLIDSRNKKNLKDHIFVLCQNVSAAQLCVKELKVMRPLKLNYAVLRFQ